MMPQAARFLLIQAKTHKGAFRLMAAYRRLILAVMMLQAAVSLLISVQKAAHLQKAGIKVTGLQGQLQEVFHILFC